MIMMITYLFVGIYTWFGSVCIWSDSNGRQTRDWHESLPAADKTNTKYNFSKIQWETSKNTRQVSLWQNWKRESLGGCNNLHKFPEENYVCNNSGFLTETCWCPFPCWLRIKTRFALQLSINVIELILHCFGYPNIKEAWSHQLV